MHLIPPVYKLIDVVELFQEGPGELLPVPKDALVGPLEHRRLDRVGALL